MSNQKWSLLRLAIFLITAAFFIASICLMLKTTKTNHTMLNEHLLQQVREGKASIETLIKNDKVVGDFTDIVDRVMERTGSGFYPVAKYHYLKSNVWFYANTNPTGLTPIPLDRFFEGEERPECICKTKPHMACLVHDYPDLPSYVTPTPEQPALPEGADDAKVFSINDIKSCFAPDRSFVGVQWLFDRMREKITLPPEQPSLPEELLREHKATTWIGENNFEKKSAAITIDYMGRFGAFVFKNGWSLNTNREWFSYRGKEVLATAQLITLFFNQQSINNGK